MWEPGAPVPGSELELESQVSALVWAWRRAQAPVQAWAWCRAQAPVQASVHSDPQAPVPGFAC